ncbi:hypothetical protein FXN63_25975 [Pigmentiphaga aceris]|uniref:Tetratricopeptide repeat protein n=1 Tax=Pigmentiphaga aceris TaxID=1940612 RepID=A0A5C0B697_9BURK|nr:hypothetical protein [Pigmentiphaga aceris]QEI08920.1 hypothetical protein FXN63_25975 [Pigmentiphaga aceris]
MVSDRRGYDTRFAALKQVLDDPDASYWGEGMRDDLLALVPDLPDTAAEAALFRELAIVEAKRDEEICLDHADRALAAHLASGALSDESRYFMHQFCAAVGVDWTDDSRAAMHLDQALLLHEKLGRPAYEAFSVRKNKGVYERKHGRARMGLDWFEPLLDDVTSQYGPDSPQVRHMLGLLCDSERRLGNIEGELAYAERSASIPDVEAEEDPGKRVSTLTWLGGVRFRAGRMDEARAAFDEAIGHADAYCRPPTQNFARESKAACFREQQAVSSNA